MAVGTAIAIASALASAASATAGAVKGRKARKKAEKEQRRLLNQMNDDNEANFLRDYYQDAFDDPTSRSYLKRISEEMYDKNKAIESSGIATGATHENVQAQKQAANRTMSDAINNVIVNHEARKEAAKNRYISRKDAISQGNMGLAQQTGEMKAQNWANLGSNLSDSITGLTSTYLGSGLNGGKMMPLLNKSGLNDVTKQSLGYIDNQMKPKLLTSF